MVTTRRSTEQSNSYENGSANGGVQLLERPVMRETSVQTETQEQAKERMQRNLNKLLNYDRYAEQEISEQVVENVEMNLSEEDIRPTSTTMQFGEDIDQIREEMRKAEQVEEPNYHLNNKGKIVAILYSLAVTIILALIVLNTGVLSSLSAQNAQKTAELNQAMNQYKAIQNQIEEVSSNQSVMEWAESNGMIKQ